MSQLYLKGVYYNAGDDGGLWFKDDTGSYEEVTTGGGVTIYTGDGQLSGDRLVELNGHLLYLSDAAGTYLQLDPKAGEEVVRLAAHSSEKNSDSYLHLNSSTDVGWGFELSSSNAINEVAIEGDAVANTLEYVAGTHIFNGSIFSGASQGVTQGPFTTITSITVTNGLVTDLQGTA